MGGRPCSGRKTWERERRGGGAQPGLIACKRRTARIGCATLPAGAVGAAEVVVDAGYVGDAQVGGVVMNFGSRAEGDDAEEHDFGEARGVLEGAGGFGFALR